VVAAARLRPSLTAGRGNFVEGMMMMVVVVGVVVVIGVGMRMWMWMWGEWVF
jgi:hypothetical protein